MAEPSSMPVVPAARREWQASGPDIDMRLQHRPRSNLGIEGGKLLNMTSLGVIPKPPVAEHVCHILIADFGDTSLCSTRFCKERLKVENEPEVHAWLNKWKEEDKRKKRKKKNSNGGTRKEKSRWEWKSTWSFNMKEIQNSGNKSLLMDNARHNQRCIQYKGFIDKKIAEEFDVSMKSHFSVLQSLGRGAEGQVYRRTSQKGGYECAVNICTSRKPTNDEPRIIIIFSTYDDYIEKKEHINAKLQSFKLIVLGLIYLHQQGIIHRDLKPDNIFLGNLKQIKIGDFGSGAFIGSPSCPGGRQFWGTELYASSELQSASAHNQKTDVFSLGVIYFELFGTSKSRSERLKRLEELQKLLKSHKWKTKPHETWLKSNLSKGWSGNEKLLIWMLENAPARRPSCTDILRVLLSEPRK
uniref:non-specific serine/threonine protein kinase n=1 Tax=Oryza brachyantha TaxID=4533 RepID=J3MP32_ORYBR